MVSVLLEGRDDLLKRSKFVYMKHASLYREQEKDKFYDFLEGREKYKLKEMSSLYID